VNGCSSIVRFGEITFDFERQKTDRNGRRIELTDKEVKILRILIEHKGQTVTRDCLLRQVWGQAVYVTVRTVDNHILRLRQKLETDPAHPRHILSAYGEGYKFCG
jgi:DNA-binding response OmpR family regulator